MPIKTTGRNEDWKHYLLKCLVYKILKDAGHEVYMEVDKGFGRVDVFDKTEGKVIEIETNPRKETTAHKMEIYSKSVYVKEIIIIDARKYDVQTAMIESLNNVISNLECEVL
jgi:predicted RNA methylase